MSWMSIAKTAVAVSLFAIALGAFAQQGPPSYGASISLEDAKKAAAAAEAEARKNHWRMAITIVDTAGQLVYFQKMDDTQNGSIKVAISKARSAALFRVPTKAFHDRLAKGFENIYLLKLDEANPVPGGFPIVMGGKIVGAIGASGGSGEQDSQVSEAGLAALK
jgi:glc operon protein GlcG